eukprot:TRINITY_DN3212_c1_g3_i1.p1 TRINITY_DN3212_c1_g3~~TRINITY_DN3212_c1_g3_i1.p1  ORF type:complete len:905 (-),score=310.58 TRINITY_DN3212_c1_g3_i1:286-3000(-)
MEDIRASQPSTSTQPGFFQDTRPRTRTQSRTFSANSGAFASARRSALNQSTTSAPIEASNAPTTDDVDPDQPLGLPPGFPPAPPKILEFPGGDEAAYKIWMKKRQTYEKWENGLLLYTLREREGNTEACSQIIERLRAELASFGSPSPSYTEEAKPGTSGRQRRPTLLLNADASYYVEKEFNANNAATSSGVPGFPPPPYDPGPFPGGGTKAYKEWMKSRLLFETWENAVQLFKRRQAEGNTGACQRILEYVRLQIQGMKTDNPLLASTAANVVTRTYSPRIIERPITSSDYVVTGKPLDTTTTTTSSSSSSTTTTNPTLDKTISVTEFSFNTFATTTSGTSTLPSTTTTTLDNNNNSKKHPFIVERKFSDSEDSKEQSSQSTTTTSSSSMSSPSPNIPTIPSSPFADEFSDDNSEHSSETNKVDQDHNHDHDSQEQEHENGQHQHHRHHHHHHHDDDDDKPVLRKRLSSPAMLEDTSKTSEKILVDKDESPVVADFQPNNLLSFMRKFRPPSDPPPEVPDFEEYQDNNNNNNDNKPIREQVLHEEDESSTSTTTTTTQDSSSTSQKSPSKPVSRNPSSNTMNNTEPQTTTTTTTSTSPVVTTRRRRSNSVPTPPLPSTMSLVNSTKALSVSSSAGSTTSISTSPSSPSLTTMTNTTTTTTTTTTTATTTTPKLVKKPTVSREKTNNNNTTNTVPTTTLSSSPMIVSSPVKSKNKLKSISKALSPKGLSEKFKSNSRRNMMQHVYFGVSLETSLQNASELGHLHFAFQAISFIELNGLETEGIFRVPGNGERIQEWRVHIDAGKPVAIAENASVHDVCGILKAYLRELPEGLVPVSCSSHYNVKDTDEMVMEKILYMFSVLPTTNKVLTHRRDNQSIKSTQLYYTHSHHVTTSVMLFYTTINMF